MSYNRPWKSYEEQLAILKSRGLQVSDEAKAINYLERLGYYRLSGYWYPFREIQLTPQDSGKISYQRLDDFMPQAQFQDAVHLYVYDKKLRLLALDALERIEVAIRSDIAHLLGKRDTFAYQKTECFQTRFIEVRRGYSVSQHQQRIALKYGVSEPKVFASWLRSLNYVRNICAHHSRLWNRNVVDQPRLSKAGEVLDLDRFRSKQGNKKPALTSEDEVARAVLRRMLKMRPSEIKHLIFWCGSIARDSIPSNEEAHE